MYDGKDSADALATEYLEIPFRKRPVPTESLSAARASGMRTVKGMTVREKQFNPSFSMQQRQRRQPEQLRCQSR